MSQLEPVAGMRPPCVRSSRSTPLEGADSLVKYRIAGETDPDAFHIARGFATKFVMPGGLNNTQWIHRALMTGLRPGTRYEYQAANATTFGTTYHFSAARDGMWLPKILVYGDFGLENAVSLPAVLKDVELGIVDVIVHNGDYAYDDFENNGTTGDQFMQMIEPIASTIPYQMSQGNHEGNYDAIHYRMRWTMTDWETTQNLYHSFNTGPIHWVAFNTEFYFAYVRPDRNFGPYPDLIAKQLTFVERDLIEANKNRAAQPWIVVFGHRPFYCSDDDDDDCVFMRNQWRTGLETLFYNYGVDIVLGAHQHTYERLWPTYDMLVRNSSTPGEPYTDPLAPVHLVTGAAGCREDTDTFNRGALGPWSAVRIADYGYARLTAIDQHTLQWEQVNATTRAVVDEIIIRKSSPLPAWLPSAKVSYV